MNPINAETQRTAEDRKERPMLFSGAMVKAILDGTKNQTRRVVKPQPEFEGVESFGESWKWRDGDDWFSGVTTEQLSGISGLLHEDRCKYKVGSRLWVKETHKFNGTMGGPRCTYRADGAELWFENAPDDAPAWIADDNHWRPSIFMPRWASRITLEITSIRVERLQEISEEDAKAEGTDDKHNVFHSFYQSEVGNVYRRNYAVLWESINGAGSWDLNPWVWCVGFKRVMPEFN